jgi:hypothetical protein
MPDRQSCQEQTADDLTRCSKDGFLLSSIQCFLGRMNKGSFRELRMLRRISAMAAQSGRR